MKRQTLVLIIFTFILKTYQGLETQNSSDSSIEYLDCGSALLLTPLIQDGKIEEAQNKSRVNYSKFDPVESYAGFLTVNPRFQSTLFFWYFPAAENPQTAPIVLWLQGGPGLSMFVGLFRENGPFELINGEVYRREHSLHRDYHVLYVDNPVGTGYSFADVEGYARDLRTVANNLYDALVQFFTLFPEIKNNELFVVGTSYGGKYAVEICSKIHEKNKIAELKINLQGFAIGNGLIDPVRQTSHSVNLYHLGLIDLATKLDLEKTERKCKSLVLSEKWLEATTCIIELEFTISYTVGHDFWLNNVVGGYDKYVNMSEITDFLDNCDVIRALHVGDHSFKDWYMVVNFMLDNYMQSVTDSLGKLLSHYRGIIYSGQLDNLCPYPLTVDVLNNLKFSAADEYSEATRHKWIVDGNVAGYVKSAGNLTEVLVRNAGHAVSIEQPKYALEILHRLTSNKPFY